MAFHNNKYLYSPKNDVLFKLMFGRECNKDLTLNLLNSVMEGIIEPIEDIEYLQSEKEVGIIVPGSARVDINCITRSKHKFTAEMQQSQKDFFIERCMVYNALIYAAQKDSNKEKAYFEQLQKNKSKYCKLEEIEDILQEEDNLKNLETGYEHVYPARLIGFLDYIQFKDRPKQHISHYCLQEVISSTRDIDPFSLTFVEFKKKKYTNPEDVKTNLDRWIYFFQNSNIVTVDELFSYIGKDRTFDKAYQQLEYNSYTPEERKAIDDASDAISSFKGAINVARADGIERGREEGIGIGIERGIRRANVEAAVRMMQDGLPDDMILKYVGISKDELVALKQKYK